MKTPVSRFRVVAYWEGISYLVLLLIAMPLKYGLGLAIAVRIVGSVHGSLFVAYMVLLALAARALGPRLTVVAAVVSLIPGGTFWLDGKLGDSEVVRAS
jgi:integral membrane protein